MLILGLALVLTPVAAQALRHRRRRRVAELTRPPGTAAAARAGIGARRVALALGAAVAAVIGFGAGVGTLIGAVAAGGILLTGRSRPTAVAAAADVAVVLDLIAGCLQAGLAMPAALDAASCAGDPVTRNACLATAAALRRGAPPGEAWADWATDPWLAPAARIAARTTDTGAAAAEDLARAAARLRAQRRALLQQRVQRAGVWVVVPLGLCFLPAFVLVAVVPVVIGMFGSLS